MHSDGHGLQGTGPWWTGAEWQLLRYPNRVEDGGPGAEMSLRACRAAARLARQVERALSAVDLSLPQYRLLALLAVSQELASALAGLLAVRPPSVTAVVDGLVQRGLVERRPDVEDRRRVTHLLTPAGRAALSAGDEAVADRLAALADHLADEERDRALDGLELWGEALDAARDRRLGTGGHARAHPRSAEQGESTVSDATTETVGR